MLSGLELYPRWVPLKSPLFILYKKVKVMIFSVRRPQYFISHTKSQRLLVRDTDSLVRKLIYITHSYRELGTPAILVNNTTPEERTRQNLLFPLCSNRFSARPNFIFL